MFLFLGILAFIVIAYFFPRFALVILVAYCFHWTNPWAIIGTVALAFIALIIDFVLMKAAVY